MEIDSASVIKCPECKQQSLKFDSAYKLYECTNEACKVTFSEKDLGKIQTVTSAVEPAKKSKCCQSAKWDTF